MAVQYKSNDLDQPILADIITHIIQNLNEWYGDSAELLSHTPEIRSYANSFMLRYLVKTSAGDKAILVKIQRNPKMNALMQTVNAPNIHANVHDEYNTLRFVQEHVQNENADVSAIRTLSYLEKYHAIVMEEFPSRSLRQLLENQRNHSKHRELNDIACRAGKWLRFFHENVNSTVELPYTVNDILAEVKSYAMRLQSYSHGRIQAQAVMDAFTQNLAGNEVQSMQFSAIHQDMTCDNVLYSEDGKVSVIDIKTKPGPVYSDLALLLIHPETFRNQIYSAGRHFSKAFLREYRNAVLEGYFGEKPVNRSFVSIHCGIRILNKWTMYEELFSRYKGTKRLLTRPLSPFVTSYFRELLRSYLNVENI